MLRVQEAEDKQVSISKKYLHGRAGVGSRAVLSTYRRPGSVFTSVYA